MPTTPSGTLTDPLLGLGLNGISDWSTQTPFLDVFKSSRPWTAHSATEWGAMDAADLEAGGWLTPEGWLRDIPPGITGVSALMLTDLPAEMLSASGTYRVTWTGEGTLSFMGAEDIVQVDATTYEVTYTPDGGRLLGITITDTNPDNPLRDISVVHTDHVAAFDAGAVFHPGWLALIEDARSLRFMDWMGTNHSTLSAWADRPQVSDATWGGPYGAPLEIMIQLANETGTDPWFTLPHLATPDFIRSFAEMVYATLDPDLKAHVEYSNEVWNWGFAQAHWAHAQGQARWGEDVGDAWVQYYGAKASEMAAIWRDVFGEDQDRLNLVIGVQTGWIGLETSVLDAPEWVAEGNAAPHTLFDSYAVTGYFDGGLGRDEKAATVLTWIADSLARAESAADVRLLTGAERAAYIAAHRYDQATALAIQELRDGSVTGNTSGSLLELGETFAYHKAQADARGLDLIMYEGGTHVVGVGQWVDNDALTAFFLHLNYTEEMGTLYTDLFDLWRDAGGTLFHAFVDVAGPSKWGSWGALRHLDDSTARWEALMAYNASEGGAWWETRASGTFAAPAFDLWEGTAGDDTHRGGAADEQMLGLTGHDTLWGMDGVDALDGGAGRDALYGGNGNDTLHGGVEPTEPSGADIALADSLWGGAGADVLLAGGRASRAWGGDGDDAFTGGVGADTARGETGRDHLDGGEGDDSLFGGDGEDTLEGGAGKDRLAGDIGDDRLYGGTGNDGMTGGAGNDTLWGEGGHDRLDGGLDHDSLWGGDGHDTLLGGSGDDTLLAGGGDDSLFGGSGDDSLEGGSGHDHLTGGEGRDRLHGGTGRDLLWGDAGHGGHHFTDGCRKSR